MLYKDLIQFTPIESIIQLRDADRESSARNLVQTYVISDQMANKLVDLAISQIQFDQPRDNRGVLVVGNYGTGKSHLMSVLSAVAEHGEMVEEIAHPKVREAARSIAGKFRVIRVEIGSVTRGLRDILLDELSAALNAWGTPYIFPPADQVNNNKNLIIQAVDAFQQKYPGMGILLVVDELLDYLRTRKQQSLILDLGFMRELGEVVEHCPFRVVCGLQETLFENPRFAFVAAELRRVRQRFETVSIVREDITFVVSERLLKKTDAQKAWITEYLRRFAPLYKSLAERMDEYVSLFPIHPTYVEIFETLTIAEKRQVLKTFSSAIRSILDMPVPENEPGMISYDHYWRFIQEDPSLRSVDDIARVMEKSAILEGLIRNSYTRPNLRDMAVRVIRALSVHRLTTSDVFLPVGVTAEGLRDGLCLFLRLPAEMNTADFLLDQVQVSLKEIMRTVQGQFISFNAENGQYYLDLKKVVDFDQKIQERGNFMEDDDLNTYFYDALRQTLNLSDTTYLTGHSIWFYELPWWDHKVTRPGYLFFGPPDERTTAQPPRDFYIYLLPPFFKREWHDEELPDEVILRFTDLDQEFEKKVRWYGGARALAHESTEYRSDYQDKAEAALHQLNRWLREHMVEKLSVVYQGVKEPVQTVLSRMRSTASQTIEDLIRLIAAHLLAPEFEEKFPDYPKFTRLSQPVTETSRPATAMEAVRLLAGRSRSALAVGVLEGLGLTDAQGNIRPYASQYANYFLRVLNDKAEGQVVNRGEVIELVAGGIQPIEKDLYFRLEPEWIVVILLTLVYNGDIVISLDGREEMDAGSLERALTRNMTDLVDFRFYKKPRSMPINVWTLIFEGLGLQPGLIRDENTRETAVTELQRLVHAELESLVRTQDRLQQGMSLWNTPVFTDRFTMVVESGTVVGSDAPDVTLSITELLPGLRGYKTFLEELSKFTTVGKLRNLRLTPGDVAAAMEYRETVKRSRQFIDLITSIQPATAYLSEAMANLSEDHAWSQKALTVQKETIEKVRRFGKGQDNADPAGLLGDLTGLKTEYVSIYSELHRKLALTAQGDDLRQRLYRDPRLESLKALSAIDLLSRSGELEIWKGQLTRLLSCREFHEGLLADTPTCPRCHLRPAQYNVGVNAEQTMRALDNRLSDILINWRKALKTNLQSEPARSSLVAMSPNERRPVEIFLEQADDEETLPDGFVQAAIQALRGIEAVTLPVAALVDAIKNGGLPCTRDELISRIRRFLDNQMRGHDVSSTRLTLDQ